MMVSLYNNHVYHYGECKMVQLLWKTVWQFLKKLNIDLTYDPAIPVLGIYSRELKTHVQLKSIREC